MLKRLSPAMPITPEILHRDLPLVMLAAVILAAGLASCILWSLRARDPLLLWLGIFASLYGARIFLANELIQIATGAGLRLLRPAAAVITYCIPIPLLLFLRELLGNGWKNSLRVWLWAQIAFAVFGVAVGVVGGYQQVAGTANNLLVIAGSLALLVQLFFFYRAESGALVLKAGFAVFLACVLLRNIGFESLGSELEPVGLLVLVLALGCVAALRAWTGEKKLVAVEQELATARRIQTAILPKSAPDMVGLDIAARYVPMTAVAGDFYDFLIIDPRRVTILVADVSGHGVPAALIASMLKVGLKVGAAAEGNNARDPAAILAGLNRMLSGMLDGQFVTAACAFIDLEARALTYSGAGHPPALLVRQGSPDVVELAENGLFLGPFPQAAYTNLTVPFESGDRLLLYTDGIIEATAAGGQPFGGDGLAAFMVRNRTARLPAFADDLIRAASGETQGSNQEDDLTLVVAQIA